MEEVGWSLGRIFLFFALIGCAGVVSEKLKVAGSLWDRIYLAWRVFCFLRYGGCADRKNTYREAHEDHEVKIDIILNR